MNEKYQQKLNTFWKAVKRTDEEKLEYFIKNYCELERWQKSIIIESLNMNSLYNLCNEHKDFCKKYNDIGSFIKIDLKNYTEEERNKLIEICDIYPNLLVGTHVIGFDSTGKEYKEAEKWIKSVIDNLNPEYSKLQKIAVIDNAIGKKISYSPDYDTEVFNVKNNQSLWKIIASGYGICDGIARIEQYILNRVGIESEVISSEKHTFLKLEDISLPTESGEEISGDTILDPTWNLTRHRFGARPENFCITYEQARENDISENGEDHCSHKDNKEFRNKTIGLDDYSLRNLFKSVGLADKNGQFPIKDFIEQSEFIDETYANQPAKNINKQLALFSQYYPDFAICQQPSMTILKDISFSNENLKFDKCAINRVYNRKDTKKRPVLFIYINSDELGSKFYFADKKQGKFVELPKEKFTEQFECYRNDLKRTNGIRPWENGGEKKNNVNSPIRFERKIDEEGEER